MSAQTFELMRDCEAMLQAQKFPFPFYYVPARTRVDQTGPTQIHFMRSRQATDLIASPQGQQKNARRLYTRKLSVDVLVYAASTLPAAMLQEHEGLCDQIVDALVCAVDTWCTGGIAGEPEYVEMRYLDNDELQELEQWPGVVYLLRFRIGRGVTAKTFLGEAKPTGSAATVKNTSAISLASTSGENPEEACGRD
jgi:hypothetical protein